jgi:acetyl esterase
VSYRTESNFAQIGRCDNATVRRQLQGLPSAWVVTSENDPLRDEGEAYARRLKEARVSVIATGYNGMIHDFVLLNGILTDPEPQAAIRQMSAEIKAHLAR